MTSDRTQAGCLFGQLPSLRKLGVMSSGLTVRAAFGTTRAVKCSQGLLRRAGEVLGNGRRCNFVAFTFKAPVADGRRPAVDELGAISRWAHARRWSAALDPVPGDFQSLEPGYAFGLRALPPLVASLCAARLVSVRARMVNRPTQEARNCCAAFRSAQVRDPTLGAVDE